MSNQLLLIEFWEFLKERKRYWLLPIVLILIMISAIIVFVESSAVVPFIYSIF